MLSRRRLGHRPLLHRLRAAVQRRHERHVRGRAGLPAQGHLVGAVRALRRDGLLHRADGDPRVHEVGRRARRQARPVEAAAARARSASRSTRRRGSGTARSSAASAARSSTPGGRPRPARSWSRRCRAPRTRSPARQASRCPASTPRCSTRTATRCRTGTQGLLALAPAVAVDAAHALQGRRALRRDVLLEVARTTYLVGDAARVRRGRLRLGHRARRRRHQRLRPPDVDRRGRVGDRRRTRRSPSRRSSARPTRTPARRSRRS